MEKSNGEVPRYLNDELEGGDFIALGQHCGGIPESFSLERGYYGTSDGPPYIDTPLSTSELEMVKQAIKRNGWDSPSLNKQGSGDESPLA